MAAAEVIVLRTTPMGDRYEAERLIFRDEPSTEALAHAIEIALDIASLDGGDPIDDAVLVETFPNDITPEALGFMSKVYQPPAVIECDDCGRADHYRA